MLEGEMQVGRQSLYMPEESLPVSLACWRQGWAHSARTVLQTPTSANTKQIALHCKPAVPANGTQHPFPVIKHRDNRPNLQPAHQVRYSRSSATGLTRRAWLMQPCCLKQRLSEHNLCKETADHLCAVGHMLSRRLAVCQPWPRGLQSPDSCPEMR